MKARGLEEYIRFVKDRAYNLSARKGYKVLISVFFIKETQRNQVVENKSRKVLSSLIDIISYQNPDSLEVQITASGQTQTYTYDLNYSNNTGFRHFSSNDENNRQMTKSNETDEIKGLGNASSKSIESIVNKRLDEERKERKLTELETIINENNETLTKNTKTIEGLESKLVSKNEEIEGLEKTIATKQSIKYFAGITGDILQSFGIKKEIVAKPLAGLLTGGEEQEGQEEPKAIEEKASFDESGIVDDEQVQKQPQSVDEKRNEMIDLMGEFLKGIDNQTLSNTFSIFSKIENNPNNSSLILEFLKNQ